LWKQHFKDLLGKSPNITDSEIISVITEELTSKKDLSQWWN
jgi:hypothetical protein